MSEQPTAEPEAFFDLSAFRNPEYDPGRGIVVRTLWYYCSLLFFESGWFPVYGPKIWLLRLFGARIGSGLVIKPHVRIKFPWRLTAGDHCWIGQNVWLDNIEDVTLGSHVCISQLVYFCTGSHDYRKRAFDLLAKPIDIRSGAWIGARTTVLGGVVVHSNAVVAGGSIVTKDVAPGAIVAGNPARQISSREK